MGISVKINSPLTRLVPLCEGGYHLPEMFQKVEECPEIQEEEYPEIECDNTLGFDGGLDNGILIAPTLYPDRTISV